MALTEKKRRFADALLSGASNKKAAIDAGYSEKTAPQAGSKLAKDPDVIAYLERRRKFDQAKAEVKDETEKVNSEREVEAKALGVDARAIAERMLIRNEEANPDLAVKLIAILMRDDQVTAVGKGKKEQAKDKAGQAAAGRFGPRPPPPRLAAVNGSKA